MKRTKKKEYGFPVLCCDPSLTAFGWAIVSDQKVLKAGCIKTEPSPKKLKIRKGDDRTRRISEINNILLGVIELYSVTYIVSEQPHGSQSSSAAVSLGLMIGMIQTISDCVGVGIEWYGESDSKKCALGKTSATKQEMIDCMKTHYNFDWTGIQYRDEAVADALAIHLVASKQSPIIKTMIKWKSK